MIWARMLAYITGTVDQELLLRNEYLAAENRILRAKIKGRLLLSHSEKTTLAEIARPTVDICYMTATASTPACASRSSLGLLRLYGTWILHALVGSTSELANALRLNMFGECRIGFLTIRDFVKIAYSGPGFSERTGCIHSVRLKAPATAT